MGNYDLSESKYGAGINSLYKNLGSTDLYNIIN
jgi:hypothetical protein